MILYSGINENLIIIIKIQCLIPCLVVRKVEILAGFCLPGACMNGQDCGWHGVCITCCGQRRCSPGAVPKMLKYFSKAADGNTGGVHKNE